MAPFATAGLDHAPAAPPAAARRANRQGLKALRGGDLARSRSLFARAVQLAPDYFIARFNLACAISRLGEGDAAVKEVEHLLQRDHHGFAPLWRADPDLSTARQSAAGRRLEARARALARTWQEAARRGLPALLRSSDGKIVRAGVYLHEVKRFYPLAPAVPGTATALIDRARARVIQVVPSIDRQACGIVCHPLLDATIVVHVIPTGASPVARLTVDEAEFPSLTLQIQSAASGVRVRWAVPHGKSGMSPWHLLTDKGRRRDPVQQQGADPVLVVDNRGSLLALQAPGHAARKGRLTAPGGGAPIALDRRHRRAHVSDILAAGGQALVASTEDRCDCESDDKMTIFRHVVSLVDLAGRRARVVRHGAAGVVARQDGDGAVYLQATVGKQMDRLVRWPSLPKVLDGPGEPIMPGVLLMPPREAEDCCSA